MSTYPKIELFDVLDIHDDRLDHPDRPGMEAMSCGVATHYVDLPDGKSTQYILPFRTTTEGPAYLLRGVDHLASGIEEFFRRGFGFASGYREMTIEIYNELGAAMAAAGKPGRMQPDELDFILMRTHNTRQSAADFVGVSVAGIGKWLDGQRSVPGPVSRILRVIAEFDDIRFAGDLQELMAKAGGAMDSVEFCTAVAECGWSLEQAAECLGVSPKTTENWSRGTRAVSAPAARLLRVISCQIPLHKKEISKLLLQATRPIAYPPALILAA